MTNPIVHAAFYDASADRARIIAALRAIGGNRKAAAEYLGISRATLYRRLHSLEIGQEPEAPRKP